MYIVGDVHGCLKTLKALVAKLPDWETEGICFTGDLGDRGPNSKGVYDYIIENGFDAVKGNHDLMLEMAIGEGREDYQKTWLSNGGTNTLESYLIKEGTDQQFVKPQIDEKSLREHAGWARRLPLYREYKNLTKDGRTLVVSHNVVYKQWRFRDSVLAHEQKYFKEQVLWGHQYNHHDNEDIYNVTGHWAKRERVRSNRGMTKFVGLRIHNFFACVDSGCGYRGGWLTALRFPQMEEYKQTMIDKIE